MLRTPPMRGIVAHGAHGAWLKLMTMTPRHVLVALGWLCLASGFVGPGRPLSGSRLVLLSAHNSQNQQQQQQQQLGRRDVLLALGSAAAAAVASSPSRADAAGGILAQPSRGEAAYGSIEKIEEYAQTLRGAGRALLVEGQSARQRKKFLDRTVDRTLRPLVVSEPGGPSCPSPLPACRPPAHRLPSPLDCRCASLCGVFPCCPRRAIGW